VRRLSQESMRFHTDCRRKERGEEGRKDGGAKGGIHIEGLRTPRGVREVNLFYYY
jgi:hypothetical protein